MSQDAELQHISRIAAELRAAELVSALRHALSGAPHWRWEARALLEQIDGGVIPELTT